MDRRNFLKSSCGACAAMGIGLMLGSGLLESCSGKGLGVLKATASNGKVGIPLESFTTSDFKLLRVNDYNFDIAVQKKEDGSFTAMVLMCTHARHPLTKAGSGYYCTLHGSKFGNDGKVQKGPASKPMVHLNTEITDGNLYVIL